MGKLAALVRKFVESTNEDADTRKALQQVIATALKHGAVTVRFALDRQTIAAVFTLKNNFSTTVEIAVSPLSFLAHVMRNANFEREENNLLLASAEVPFKSLQMAFSASIISDSGNLVNTSEELQIGKSETYLELANFGVIREPISVDDDLSLSDERLVKSPSNPLHGKNVFAIKENGAANARQAQQVNNDDLRLKDESQLGRLGRTNKLLLVIDDDEDQREILRRVFELEGYDVLLASDGIDGVVSANKSQPDIIVVDFMMPDFDGCETIKRLRKEAATKKIPVVALTAYPDADVECRLLDAGANDFCSKAVSKKVLLKRIERLI